MKSGVALFISLIFTIPGLYAADVEQNIRDGLFRLVPEMEIDSIRPTPVKGLYQVIFGPDVIYVSADGNYVLKGDLLDVNQRRNLTEDVRADSRISLLKNIAKTEYIEFPAESEKDRIYVFTDIDCGYCRKLHQDVPELNARGVTVRYLAYPRAGVDSATGKEMASVWCSENKQEALTRAKNSKSVKSEDCDAPIAQQYDLGRKIGVRGTPAIFLENGQAIPGYMPPDRLIQTMHE